MCKCVKCCSKEPAPFTDSLVAKSKRDLAESKALRFSRRGFGMKQKTIAAFGSFAASTVLFLIFMTAEADAQLLDRTLSLGNLAHNLRTPQDVAFYIWRHFDFENDQRQFGREDYWQSPAEMLQNQKGDCEDFAIFAREILKKNGIAAFVVNLYSGKSHSICIFKNHGLYGAVDGGNYVAADFKDLSSLLAYLDPFWKKAAITEMGENHRGRILAEISNCHKSRKNC